MTGRYHIVTSPAPRRCLSAKFRLGEGDDYIKSAMPRSSRAGVVATPTDARIIDRYQAETAPISAGYGGAHEGLTPSGGHVEIVRPRDGIPRREHLHAVLPGARQRCALTQGQALSTAAPARGPLPVIDPLPGGLPGARHSAVRAAARRHAGPAARASGRPMAGLEGSLAHLSPDTHGGLMRPRLSRSRSSPATRSRRPWPW